MSDPNTEKPLEKLSEYEKELELAKKSTDMVNISSSLLNLAKFCYEINAIDFGLKYIQEALEISEKNSDFPTPYEFYTLLGDFNFEQGLLNDSYDAYERSNKIIPKNKFLELFTINCVKMGRVSEISEKYSKAIKHYKEAEKLFEKLGMHAERAKIFNAIGLVHLKKIPEDLTTTFDKLGHHNMTGGLRFDKAKKNFNRAIMILDQHDLRETEIVLYKTIKANLEGKFSDYWSLF